MMQENKEDESSSNEPCSANPSVVINASAHVSQARRDGKRNGDPANEPKKQNNAPRRTCMFGDKCRRKGCKFVHPPSNRNGNDKTPGSDKISNGKLTTAERSGRGAGTKSPACRHGIKCWSKNCKFLHPPGWNPSSIAGNKTNSPKARQSTTTPNDDDLETGLYYGTLRPVDSTGYKAAGILMLRCRRQQRSFLSTTTPSNYYEATVDTAATIPTTASSSAATDSTTKEIQVLLCAEVRKKSKSVSGTLELNFIGGKVEPQDRGIPCITAAREFWEETGKIVPLSACLSLVGIRDRQEDANQQSTTPTVPDAPGAATNKTVETIWCGPGKYVLYVVHDDNEQDDHMSLWDELPFKYGEKSSKGELPHGAEPDHLVWVDWELILNYVSQEKKLRTPMAFGVPPSITDEANGGQPSTTDNGHCTIHLSRFCASLLKESILQKGVNSAIQNLTSRERQKSDNTTNEQDAPTDDNGDDDITKSFENLHLRDTAREE